MSQDEIEVSLKIGNRFYEGRLHPQKASSQAPDARPPMFPELYSKMLTVTDGGTYWHIKPKKFLQTADFAEIARLVKQLGGEYISAGKASHFDIPK